MSGHMPGWMTVVAVLSASFLTVGAAEPNTASRVIKVDPAKVNPIGLHGDLYRAVSSGAEVFVGQVSRHQKNENSDRNFERGELTLRVARNVYGSKQEAVQLPYANWNPEAGYVSNFDEIWPSLNELKDTWVLVVVIPGASDRLAGASKDTYGAASDVIRLKSEDDPLVETIRDVLAIRSVKDKKALVEKITPCLTNSNRLVRRFAMEALMAQLAPMDFDATVALIAQHVVQADADKAMTADVHDGIMILGISVMSGDSSKENRESVVRRLAELAALPSSQLLESASLTWLATLVRGPKAPPATGCVAPQTADALKKKLSEWETSRHNSTRSNAAVVAAWLRGGAATQPASESSR